MNVVKWKKVKDYEGLYEINETGHVRSLHKRNFQKIMPQRVDRAGYLTVRLSKKGKDSTVYVHRLLGFAFISNPAPLNKRFINHKDCNKLNNSLENLEWVSHSENMKHAYSSGVLNKNKGKNHHEAAPLKCIETGEVFHTIKAAAENAGMNYNTFRNALNDGTITAYMKIAC